MGLTGFSLEFYNQEPFADTLETLVELSVSSVEKNFRDLAIPSHHPCWMALLVMQLADYVNHDLASPINISLPFTGTEVV